MASTPASTPLAVDAPVPRRILPVITVSQFAGTSLWFAVNAVMPDLQRDSAEAMREQYHRQMEKLLTKYGKIDLLWFDGGETEMKPSVSGRRISSCMPM